MADEDLVRPSVVKYFIGETRLLWERVRNDERVAITPTACTLAIWNRDTNTLLLNPAVTRLSAGKVEYVLANSVITSPGNYIAEWDITYTDGGETVVMTITTDIVAEYKDGTYLMSLVARMRLMVDDDPEDMNRRIKTDGQLKKYLVEAVRLKMSDYSVTTSGLQDEITPEPTAESTDEKLLILWASWIYYTFGTSAIAAERSRMFSITYAQAYQQLRDRREALQDDIIELDPTQAMVFDSETSIEFYGQVDDRTSDAIATWIG